MHTYYILYTELTDNFFCGYKMSPPTLKKLEVFRTSFIEHVPFMIILGLNLHSIRLASITKTSLEKKITIN